MEEENGEQEHAEVGSNDQAIGVVHKREGRVAVEIFFFCAFAGVSFSIACLSWRILFCRGTGGRLLTWSLDGARKKEKKIFFPRSKSKVHKHCPSA